MEMSFAGTAALGAVAGFTIFLGLPIARFGRPSARLMSFLNAASVGVLLFLLYDVISKANATVEAKLSDDHLTGAGYGLLLAVGIGVGLLGLVVFEKLVIKRKPRQGVPAQGPGAMAATASPGLRAEAVDEGIPAAPAAVRRPLSAAARVSLFISIGIGLHNFSEGLAIGQSARLGLDELFGVLVIGFGLHNITEGFGISGPLVGSGERPSWAFLGLLGLIGGGPTFAGTLIGYQTTSAALSVLFLSLAAGAIIYVVGELQNAGRRIGAHDIAMIGILVGFLAGYGTDKLLFVAGG